MVECTQPGELMIASFTFISLFNVVYVRIILLLAAETHKVLLERGKDKRENVRDSCCQMKGAVSRWHDVTELQLESSRQLCRHLAYAVTFRQYIRDERRI